MSCTTTAPYALVCVCVFLCSSTPLPWHIRSVSQSQTLWPHHVTLRAQAMSYTTQTISLLRPYAKGQHQCVLLLLACQGHVWQLDRRVSAGAGADCLDRQGDRGDAARNSTSGDQVVKSASLVGLLLVRLCRRRLCAYSRTRDTDRSSTQEDFGSFLCVGISCLKRQRKRSCTHL